MFQKKGGGPNRQFIEPGPIVEFSTDFVRGVTVERTGERNGRRVVGLMILTMVPH
jgi:hypothetical protein